MAKTLIKLEVCDECMSPNDIHHDCVCFEEKYKTITLEFESCPCCGSIEEDFPESEFNTQQLINHFGKEEIDRREAFYHSIVGKINK